MKLKLKKTNILLPLAATAVLALPLLTIRTRLVQAAAGADCVPSSGAATVESVINACSLYGGRHRGAAWINSKADKAESTVYASDWDTAVAIKLWGQVYGSAGGPYYAVKVMLLSDGTYNDDNPQPYSTTPANVLGGISVVGAFNRGAIGGNPGWSQGGSADGTLTPRTFFDNPDDQCTTGSNGDQICRKDVHVYRCFSTTADDSGVNKADGAKPCYSDASHVQMLLHGPDPSDSKSYFESKSKVSIAAQGDISAHELTTDIDKTGDTIRFSTDNTHVSVDFKHWLYYHNLQAMRSIDTYTPAATPWKVERQVTTCNKVSSSCEAGEWKNVDPEGDDDDWNDWTPGGQNVAPSDKTKTSANSYLIDFDPSNNRSSGVPQYKKVCQRIAYKKKYFKYSSADQENGAGGYIYNLTDTGNGKSSVCVRIDYVGGNTDDGDDPLVANPNAAASVKLDASEGAGDAMLAGEEADLSITGSAKGIPTRRLIGKRAGVFDYNADAAYNTQLSKSNPRYNNPTLCPMFLAFTPRPNNCYDLKFYSADYNILDSEAQPPTPDGTEVTSEGSYGHDEDAGGEISGSSAHQNKVSVVVPDDIGKKYCNAFGWKFRYYYMIKKNGNEKWYKEPSKDYFFVPKPACRTIAKKPTMAAWNGGVATNDSIVASLAPRNLIGNNGPTFGDMWANSAFQHADGTAITGNTTNLYGSWAEYFAVSQNGMTAARAIGSGASLSKGAPNNSLICANANAPWETNSPLTIANVSCNLLNGLGASVSSSAFRTRLNAYLKNAASGSGMTVIDKTSDTNYEINNDLINSGDYSIRNVPQMIIFANNVNITSGVKRIDAWIIATGTVNTCAEYNKDTNRNGTIEDGERTTSDGVNNGVGVRGSACNEQLVFNGPVVANKVQLNRTFGADAQATVTKGMDTAGNTSVNSTRQSSAEVFNLRADTYLWAYTQAARYSSSYKEVYSRELAPRY